MKEFSCECKVQMLQKYLIKISAQFVVGRAELKYKVTDTVLRVSFNSMNYCMYLSRM